MRNGLLRQRSRSFFLSWNDFLIRITLFRLASLGALRWARFLPDEKSGKESPKAGPSPALWNPPRGTGCSCALLFLALSLVGPHRWCGYSTGNTDFSGKQYFYFQGLALVCNCSQLPVARLPAAGTPLFQGRPGGGNRLVIGPAAYGSLVWWHKQGPQQG